MDNLISEIKREFTHQIDNFPKDSIVNLIKTIKECTRSVYTIGVGKSGNIAKHFSDLLKCISISSSQLDLLNLTHGDIGVLKNDDLVLIFSNSGNTLEILNVLPSIKDKGVKVCGVFCNKNGKMSPLCDLCVVCPLQAELSGEINKIPTNSIMSQLILCNIVISILKNDINISDYRNNHPAGNIGKGLLKIRDIIITDFPKIRLDKDVDLHTILLGMTRYSIGCMFFIDKYDNLLGILTDGDVRRLLVQDSTLNKITQSNITTNHFSITDPDIFMNEITIELQKYSYIPVLENRILLGIIRSQNFSNL